jgi:glycerol-3-phosphate O-acyltransferase
LSKINYKNAEDFFITHGVTGSEDKEQIEFYADAIQKYLRLL